MREIDAFFDELNPDIKVIWGLSDDDSLDEDAKVTILATGLNNELADEIQDNPVTTTKDEDDYQRIIDKLYHPIRDDFQSRGKEDSQKRIFLQSPLTLNLQTSLMRSQPHSPPKLRQKNLQS